MDAWALPPCAGEEVIFPSASGEAAGFPVSGVRVLSDGGNLQVIPESPTFP